MNKLSSLVSFALVASFSLVASAQDAPAKADKPAKPVVCLAYSIAKTDGADVAICRDNKRPALFSRFAIVDMPGKAEGSLKVLLGWR